MFLDRLGNEIRGGDLLIAGNGVGLFLVDIVKPLEIEDSFFDARLFGWWLESSAGSFRLRNRLGYTESSARFWCWDWEIVRNTYAA